MLTIVYSTQKDSDYNKTFKEHLLNTISLKNVQILEYENFNQYSLSELYNKGISESKYNIIVCIHNDIKLEIGWGKKLLKTFEENQDYSIIGKIGSCYFSESGNYMEIDEAMVGQIYYHPEKHNKWLCRHSTKLPELIPVITLDGLFISFDKTKIKHQFDETIGKFQFYDHSFCVPNYIDGIKIGVTTSFDITHLSTGEPTLNNEARDGFLKKYKTSLPLDLKPKSPYVEYIKEKPIKNIGKIAVIIPTKGNVEMLFDCVNSFYQYCNSNLFKIFIADTGSTDDEKKWIKNNISPLGNIELIEYDYYNFAKINNDVVKNYINDEYEFLLFCNNDIKLLNNVIYNMLSIFKENGNVGTVGGRLHFEDNTIQHSGMIIKQDNDVDITHIGYKSYYNFINGNTSKCWVTPSLLGNTAALLMIRKNLFNKCGMFNENYTEYFEDIELNLKCLLLGYNNYMSGKSVAIHYESKTRNEVSGITEREKKDKIRLFEFIENHNRKLFKI